MAVYMIIDIEVKEDEAYSEYIDRVYEIVTKYGGKYLVRGGKITPVSNMWNPERIIVIEFQNIRQMEECFESHEYSEIAPLREQSTASKAIVVEGYSE